MIEKYNQMLVALREKRIDLKDFLYKEGKDDRGYTYDLNALKRFQLLKALQFNQTNSDEKLIVELLKAEIERHKKSAFQGIHPALRLNAYLLASYQKPEYSELFLEAKQANFDTHCGLDCQFLISAGIEDTFGFIRSKKPEIIGKFNEYVANISEAELIEWRRYLSGEYPKTLDLKSVSDEIELAIELEETEILKKKIKEWQLSIDDWTQEELNQLSYYKNLVNDLEGKIWAHEKLLKIVSSDWDKTSQLCLLSELYLKAGDPDNAWDRLKETHQYLKQMSDWRTVGLGRSIVENSLDVVLSISNPENYTAIEAFHWVSGEIRKIEFLYMELIEKTAKAGDLMGDEILRDEFYRLLEIKKREFD